MTEVDDRPPMTKAQDDLIDLLAQYDEATRARDWPKVSTLDREIDAARARRDRLRPGA